jgi:translation initiation factor 1
MPPSAPPTPQEKKAAPSLSQATLALALRGTLSLRHERKGHGGKTVTKITGLQGDSAALDEIATQMKKSLGCGARIEGNEIILQGEMLERARLWLEEHGARRITLATRPTSPTPTPHKKP